MYRVVKVIEQEFKTPFILLYAVFAIPIRLRISVLHFPVGVTILPKYWNWLSCSNTSSFTFTLQWYSWFLGENHDEGFSFVDGESFHFTFLDCLVHHALHEYSIIGVPQAIDVHSPDDEAFHIFNMMHNHFRIKGEHVW